DRRHSLLARRDARELLQLLLALAVELEDARLQRGRHLFLPLADAGEDDLARVPACLQHAEELSTGDDVEAEPLAREQREQGEIRRGLHREAGQEVESPKRGTEPPGVAKQGRRRVDVRWRSHFFGQLGQRHVLAAQLALAALEVIHRAPPSAVPASGPTSGAGGRGGPLTPQTTSVEVARTMSARTRRLIGLERDRQKQAYRVRDGGALARGYVAEAVERHEHSVGQPGVEL